MNRKGALWPIAIAGVLGGTVAANAFILVEANRGNVAIEPDYYRKAVAWDSTLAQAGRNAQLAWRITARSCTVCHQMVHGSNAPSGKALLR